MRARVTANFPKTDSAAGAGERRAVTVNRYFCCPGSLKQVFKSSLRIEDGFFGALHLAENHVTANVPGAVLPGVNEVKPARIGTAMQQVVQPIVAVNCRK